MKYIIDISPKTLDIINPMIQKGEYRTVQEFINTAIQNQIYLIEKPESNIVTSDAHIISTPLQNRERKIESVPLLKLDTFSIQTTTPNPVNENQTLSGFWNKFLPIKITVRVLANMLDNSEPSALLDLLHENASLEARKLGLDLVKKERGSGRKRGDRFFTGLPVKRSSAKSRLRFKSHFVGRLSRNKIDGMPGILGLINILRGTDGKDYASLTQKGLEFAQHENPIIDKKDYSETLSEEEQSFFLTLIQTRLPAEYKEIKELLVLINSGHSDTKKILEELKNTKSDLNQNKLSILLSGRLNRLVDLKLVIRKYTGLVYNYELSNKGKKIIQG